MGIPISLLFGCAVVARKFGGCRLYHLFIAGSITAILGMFAVKRFENILDRYVASSDFALCYFSGFCVGGVIGVFLLFVVHRAWVSVVAAWRSSAKDNA